MVGLFTPVPLYVAGIVYAIFHRACCCCCCPNETERAEEAQKQKLRESRTLRRQAREQTKLKKNKKAGATEISNGTSEELSLKPFATTDTGGSNLCSDSNNGTPLVDQHSNDAREKH